MDNTMRALLAIGLIVLAIKLCVVVCALFEKNADED